MAIIGIDVSKAKLDCVWLRDIHTQKIKSKQLPNTAKGYQALLDWCTKNTNESITSLHFVLEATGIYHEAAAYALHEAGAVVSVVNPARIRDYAKSLGSLNKTDKKDSCIIAQYGATQQPRIWQPEPPQIRELKALLARYEGVKQDIQREINRLEKARITQASVDVQQSIETVRTQLETERDRLATLIDSHIDQYPDLKQDRDLLKSIPGIGPILSQQMLAMIHSRMFVSAKQCAAFAGLVPVQHESGSSVRGRSHLSKVGNAQLRSKLYMAAIVAKEHNPDIKQQYERLLRAGKSKMCALCAAMRKLVHMCFGVLKHRTPYRVQTNLSHA